MGMVVWVRLAGGVSDLVLMLGSRMVLMAVMNVLLVDCVVLLMRLDGFCGPSVLENMDLGGGDAAAIDLFDGQ